MLEAVLVRGSHEYACCISFFMWDWRGSPPELLERPPPYILRTSRWSELGANRVQCLAIWYTQLPSDSSRTPRVESVPSLLCHRSNGAPCTAAVYSRAASATSRGKTSTRGGTHAHAVSLCRDSSSVVVILTRSSRLSERSKQPHSQNLLLRPRLPYFVSSLSLLEVTQTAILQA